MPTCLPLYPVQEHVASAVLIEFSLILRSSVLGDLDEGNLSYITAIRCVRQWYTRIGGTIPNYSS